MIRMALSSDSPAFSNDDENACFSIIAIAFLCIKSKGKHVIVVEYVNGAHFVQWLSKIYDHF